MIRAYCPECKKYPEILFANVNFYDEEGRITENYSVQLGNNGISNNLWEDGTAGVPDENF